MQLTTIGVDLAKNCFQIAIADPEFRIRQRQRLTRTKFIEVMSNLPKALVVMEACGTSNHWARRLMQMGHEVKLLPAQHVKAYVLRNKTDAGDAAALIDASRSERILPVAIKSVDQQVLQQLHRLRTQWQGARVARINSLRGMLREFGFDIAKGPNVGLGQVREVLELADNGLPDALRPFIGAVLTEIDELEDRCQEALRTLKTLTREDPVVQRLEEIRGVGPMIATAMRAAIPDIHRFPTARHLASWLGLTPKENSSGQKRRIGKISKAGDVYLRTLLIHGARSVLNWLKKAEAKGHKLDRLRRWAFETEQRIGKNKAAVALANKLARIIWANWKHERDYQDNWHRPAVAATTN